MAESLFKRDQEINEFKQMQHGLQQKRNQLIGELKREHLQLFTDISENMDDDKFQDAIISLLEYLNTMKAKDKSNGDLINHAIAEITVYRK